LASSLSGPGKAALLARRGSAQNLDEWLTKSLVRTVKDPNRLRVMFKQARSLSEASQRLAMPSKGSGGQKQKKSNKPKQE